MSFGFADFLRNQQISSIFLRKEHALRFFALILFNTISALLEGVSFGLITLALTSYNQAEKFNSFFWFDWIPLYFETQGVSLFVFLTLLAVGVQILRSTLTYLGQFQASLLTLKIQGTLQKRIFQQILRFSFRCVNRYKLGDLIEYINTPLFSVTRTVDGMNGFILSLFTIGALVWVMLQISIYFSLSVFGFFIVVGLFQYLMIRKIRKISEYQVKTLTDVNKEIAQNLQGIRTIHLFSQQKDLGCKVNRLIDRACSSTSKLLVRTLSIRPMNEIVGILLVGVCLIIGPFILSNENEEMVPYLLSFLTIMYRLATRVQSLMIATTEIASQSGYFDRMNDILSNEGKEFVDQKKEELLGVWKKIIFKDCSFRYESHLPFVFQNLNLSFSRGKFVAIVGHSGAGKSSVIDLLLRLYEPSGGEILVDDVPLGAYSMDSWRGKIGVVSQEAFVFHETIEENIRCGSNEGGLEEIISVAKIAGVDEFVSSFPDGYRTVVGERGYRLSGGEKQRICLARALFRKPQILILDEATSNLDSHSEKKILHAIELLRQQITIIAVAHRLSTVIQADKIFVFQNGKVIEEGAHTELLSINGYYTSLWHVQDPMKKKETLSLA